MSSEFLDITDGTQFVYHYTSLSKALEGILPTRNFRWGRFTTSRDPAENKAPVSNSYPSSDVDPNEYLRILQAAHEEQGRFHRRLRMACFTMESERKLSRGEIEPRGFARSAMWDHYADGSKGVCIVLDKRLLQACMEIHVEKLNFQHAEVSYKKQELVNDSQVHWYSPHEFAKSSPKNAVRAHYERNPMEFMFTKATDYSYEHEYRWVCEVSEENENVDVNIEEALHAIVVGADFNQSYGPSLSALCNSRQSRSYLPILAVSWRGGRFLRPSPVEWHSPDAWNSTGTPLK